MKIKSFFYAAAVALFALAACNKPDGPDPEPSLIVDPATDIVLSEDGGSVTVNVTATRDWKVVCDDEWLKFSVDGKDIKDEKIAASEKAVTVEISALANEGNDRETTVTFNGGTVAKASVLVKQAGKAGHIDPIEKGDGTEAKPFSASQAHAEAAKLASGAESDKAYYIRGKIHKLGSKHTDDQIKQYGNGQFYISDTGEADENDFYCYQVNFLGNTKFTSADQVKVGDDVVVYGKITNYNGTYETVGKGAAYIYKLNGQGAQAPDNVVTEKVADVLAAANASPVTLNKAIVVATSKKGYLVTDAQKADFVFVYHAGAEGTVYPKVGDKVNITGEKAEYSSMVQLTTPTTVIVSSGESVTYPAPEDISASFDSFTSSKVKYVSYTGKLSVDTSKGYYNVNVTGATKNIGSLLAPDQIDVDKYNGVDNVTFTGYYIYTTSSKYIYLILTDAKPASGDFFSVNATSLSVNATDAKASFEISASDGVKWTVETSDAEKVKVSAASGSGNAKIDVTVANNEAFESRTFTVTVKTDANVATKSYSVTINQAAAVDPNAKYVELTNAEIKASLAAGSQTSDVYGAVTFSSASGNWPANANAKKTLEYLQLRNNQGSFIESPVFANSIAKVEIVVNAKTVVRTLYCIPADVSLPSTDKNNTYNLADNAAMFANAYGSATCEKSVAQTITINFTGDTKQFKLVPYDGAVYLDAIKVYFK